MTLCRLADSGLASYCALLCITHIWCQQPSSVQGQKSKSRLTSKTAGSSFGLETILMCPLSHCCHSAALLLLRPAWWHVSCADGVMSCTDVPCHVVLCCAVPCTDVPCCSAAEVSGPTADEVEDIMALVQLSVSRDQQLEQELGLQHPAEEAGGAGRKATKVGSCLFFVHQLGCLLHCCAVVCNTPHLDTSALRLASGVSWISLC